MNCTGIPVGTRRTREPKPSAPPKELHAGVAVCAREGTENDDWVGTFVNRWVYDVEHRLRNELEALKESLRCEDERTRERATKEAREILGWLYRPPAPLSADEKLRKLHVATKDSNLSAEEQLTNVIRVLRSTGRPRGRPHTETAQHAIRAFSIHLATPLSWREISLKLKGPCGHVKNNPNPKERNCPHCGDAIRDAVGRLEKFLRGKGYHPDLPRRIDLEGTSIVDRRRLRNAVRNSKIPASPPWR